MRTSLEKRKRPDTCNDMEDSAENTNVRTIMAGSKPASSSNIYSKGCFFFIWKLSMYKKIKKIEHLKTLKTSLCMDITSE